MSKHPPIASQDYDAYWKSARRICVYRLGKMWEVERWSPDLDGGTEMEFPTHSEAIAYADRIARQDI